MMREEAVASGGRSKVLEEEKVHDMLERLCDPKLPEGRWLTALDFVERKVKMGVGGEG